MQRIIPHDVDALQGAHSVLLIISNHVGSLQGGHNVQLIIYNIIVLSKITFPTIRHHHSACKQEDRSQKCPLLRYIRKLNFPHIMRYIRHLWINLDRSMRLVRQHGGERMCEGIIFHIFILNGWI